MSFVGSLSAPADLFAAESAGAPPSAVGGAAAATAGAPAAAAPAAPFLGAFWVQICLMLPVPAAADSALRLAGWREPAACDGGDTVPADDDSVD